LPVGDTASWLNQAEVYFSVAQRKVLQPNNFADLDALEQSLFAFGRHYQPGGLPAPLLASPSERGFALTVAPEVTLQSVEQPAEAVALAADQILYARSAQPDARGCAGSSARTILGAPAVAVG
jgi:hypothetical protein